MGVLGRLRTRALKLLEQTVKDAPDDAEVLMSLAEIYRADGKNDLARPLYERAIKLDPSQVTASVGLGGIMMERADSNMGVAKVEQRWWRGRHRSQPVPACQKRGTALHPS